jgi:hypothetical protein
MSMKQETHYTRKAFIEDSVSAYIRNNPVEYQQFVSQVKAKRAKLFDKKFGQMKTFKNGKAKVDEDTFRVALSIPSKLWNVFDTVLDGRENSRFGEEKGELGWFAKKFPEFYLPEKY